MDQYAIVYQDSDGDWWCELGDDNFVRHGSISNLPFDYSRKVSVLQHCDLHIHLSGIGRRVSARRYWVLKMLADDDKLNYYVQWLKM